MKKLVLFLVLMVVIIGIFALTQEKKSAVCTGCNVILISIDTLAAKETTPYTPELSTMPFLASLAAERGVVFENAYSQAPWTLPSHTAMLTGKYPWDLGVWEFLDALPLSTDTLAERLYAAGYRTAMFSNGSFVQPQWHFDQGFEETRGSLAVRDWNDLPALFREGEAWMMQEKTGTGKPFFLFLRPFEAHDPYRDGTDIHELIALNKATSSPSHEEIASLREGYRADLQLVDTALKELFTSLEESGKANRTIVVITSDHGEEFGEHGTTGLHGTTVYNESIHVPLLAFVPGIEARRVPASVEVRSIPATILELTGTPYNSAEIGTSLAAHMLGERTNDMLVRSRTRISRDELLATLEQAYTNIDLIMNKTVVPKERSTAYTGSFSDAALLGTTKVVRMLGDNTLRYDLAADPSEQSPLPLSGTTAWYLNSYIGR